MRTKYTILLLLIIVLSCTKSKKNILSEKKTSDSLNYYTTMLSKNNLTDDVFLVYTNNSYKIIKNLKNISKNRDTLFNLSLNYYNKTYFACFI